MTKKIFRAILLVALSVLLASVAFIMGTVYDYFISVQENQLKFELSLASEAVEFEGIEYLQKFKLEECRLTWVDADGAVIYDSKKDAASMENHAQREEIKEALATGTGESSRYSSTLTEKTLYRAVKLSDGTVLRMSVSYYSVPVLLMGMLQPIFVVLALALILSTVLAHRISKRIVKPLENINFDLPLENDTYEELSPVLTHMEQQRRRIDKQLSLLKSKQNEFDVITANLKEGLILLNNNGSIVSINPSAREFFHTTESCVGDDFLTIDRNQEINKAIKQAIESGRSEIQLEHENHEYQFNISRVDSDKNVQGVAILIFDVTDRLLAEQRRREFTANVSHELKTPLQAIMGSAELLEKNLVKPEDYGRFVGHIRFESARLLTLINDIIRLSQLDENSELVWETADLGEIAREEADSLQTLAEEKHIIISVSGNAQLFCVKQLVHEIIYNLCDNAIKYSGDSARVDISVEDTGNQIILKVADTGVGIPFEHQSRIFERFYRVDKSHSKSSGGTGLGLSIVKHAVQYLNGTVSVNSTPGKGSVFTAVFQKNKQQK